MGKRTVVLESSTPNHSNPASLVGIHLRDCATKFLSEHIIIKNIKNIIKKLKHYRDVHAILQYNSPSRLWRGNRSLMQVAVTGGGGETGRGVDIG